MTRPRQIDWIAQQRAADRAAMIVEMYRAGNSLRQIGAIVNFSHVHVRNILLGEGEPLRAAVRVSRRKDIEASSAALAKAISKLQLRKSRDAEIKRLRAALTKIAEKDCDGLHLHTPQAMQHIALAALATSRFAQ